MEPLLSIVATARNDNHGGDLLRRMQIFINGILAQAEKYKVSVELVLVEWNPPVDNPKLAQALSWSENHSFCTVRIIEVSSEIHIRYRHAASLPLYQMIAKNVGIRRARGEYIVATNIDILFSEELFEYLASNQLEPGKIYRVDRYDVKGDVPLNAKIQEQLEYCKHNIIRFNSKYGTFNWNTPIPKNEESDYITLHTNACGDFQLMHREHWFKLRGYPEFDTYSMHLDSFLEFTAYYGGLEEVELRDPMRIYHIEHSIGSGWTPEGQTALENRLKSANIPSVTFHELLTLGCIMEIQDQAFWFNEESWGLAHEILPELTVLQPTSLSNIPSGCIKATNVQFKLKIDDRYLLYGNFAAFQEIIQTELYKSVLGDTVTKLKKLLLNENGEKAKKIIIFGPGEGFREFVLPLLMHLQFYPDYLLDNDPVKHDTEYAGIKIHPVERLLEEPQEGVLIIIASFMYYPAMVAQLEAMGFSRERNIYWMMHRYILAVRKCWHLINEDSMSLR